MVHGTMVRRGAAAVASTVLLAGCGLMGGDPVVSSQGEVVDELLALRDGARARATAELTIDEDELRSALRDDPDALAMLRELADEEGVEDVDALLAQLDEAQTELARQALLLEVGADRSVRFAAEHDGTVWADLRVGTDAAGPADLDDGASIDLQLQVDWATAAVVLEEPALRDDLDGALAAVRSFGSAPELAALTDLAAAFLTGELVGISGTFTPDLLGPLAGADVPGTTDRSEALADVDPRDALTTAFTFDGFRRDGDDTVVDVTVEVATLGEAVLDTLAEDPSIAGMTFADVEEARAELAELPAQLTDVATLRLDPDGTLTQVRVDLLDLGLQLAIAHAGDEADLATAERLAEQLDATGMFLVLDVADVGAVDSVLGEPTTTVTPRQVADAVGALFRNALGGGFGQLPPGALGELGGLEG